MKAYKQVRNTKKPNEYKSGKRHYSGANRELKDGTPDEYKARKQHYGSANRKEMLTKTHGGWIWRVSEFTNL